MRRSENITFMEGVKWVLEQLSVDMSPSEIVAKARKEANKLYPDWPDFPPPSKGNH